MDKNKFDFIKYIDDIILKKQEYIDVDFIIDYMDIFDYNLSKKISILKKIYSYNLNLVKDLALEVSNLSQIETSNNTEIANIKLNESLSNYTNKQNSNKYSCKTIDISNYVELIDSFESFSDYKCLYQIIDASNFLNIINQIIAYYILENITLKKLKKEDRTSEILLDEELRINNIIKNLNNIKNNQISADNIINNRLIYLTKPSGNINFLDSLDDIPNEQYESVYNAFLSICNNTFRDNKQFVSCPLSRVRSDSIRIYYLQVTSNLYLIADVKVKKLVNSNRYNEYIKRISKEASIQKNYFLSLDSNSQNKMIADHEVITQQIISSLTAKEKVLK